jgi:hypothetical protein
MTCGVSLYACVVRILHWPFQFGREQFEAWQMAQLVPSAVMVVGHVSVILNETLLVVVGLQSCWAS